MDTIARARSLRKSMTPEEARMWVRLRALRDAGHHFPRQAPVDGYYPDFVCKRRRLIVEIDGSQHGEEPQQTFDSHRDAQLRAKGYRILRFWNSDIDANIDGAMDTILAALSGSE
ncbi:MAG: endonuclease domain-containing protein [Rhizobiales bacterium]|nr:endonuclease domain-containing protein [Hyphomicrobiales bacterium]